MNKRSRHLIPVTRKLSRDIEEMADNPLPDLTQKYASLAEYFIKQEEAIDGVVGPNSIQKSMEAFSEAAHEYRVAHGYDPYRKIWPYR